MEFLNQEVNTIDSFFNNLCSETAHDKVMYLSILVDSDDKELVNMYKEAATKHNNKIMNDPHFYDAGFDLYLPKNENACYGTGTIFFKKNLDGRINKVDFKVKCCAKMYHNGQMFSNVKNYYTPFYTYARSSMSKTPLRLANNQGIIDAGYRGNLIGMFDCIYNNGSNDKNYDGYYMDAYSRMLQICAPGLVPIYVHIVTNIEELGPSTSRGEGGIGSTGI
jgi:dUTP pyrophosphatase